MYRDVADSTRYSGYVTEFCRRYRSAGECFSHAAEITGIADLATGFVCLVPWHGKIVAWHGTILTGVPWNDLWNDRNDAIESTSLQMSGTALISGEERRGCDNF